MLAKQNIKIDLTNGVDTKTDDILTLSTKMSSVKNAEVVGKTWRNREKWGLLQTAPTGYTDEGVRLAGSGSVNVGTPERLYRLGQEMVVKADNGIFSLDTTGNTTIRKSKYYKPFCAELTACMNDPAQVVSGDIATNEPFGGNLRVVAQALQINTNTVSIYATIYRNGQILQRALIAINSGVGATVKCLYNNTFGKFYIFYTDIGGGNLYGIAFSASSPTLNGVSTITIAGINVASGYSPLDVCNADFTSGGAICIAYMPTAGGVTLAKLNTTMGIVGSNNTAAPVLPNSFSCTTLNGGAGTSVYYVWFRDDNTAADLYHYRANIDSGGAATLATHAGINPTRNIGTIANGDGTGAETLVLVDVQTGSEATNNAIKAYRWTGAALSLISANAVLSLGVTTRPFRMNGRIFVGATLRSKTQPTFYIVEVLVEDNTTGFAVTTVRGPGVQEVVARVSLNGVSYANTFAYISSIHVLTDGSLLGSVLRGNGNNELAATGSVTNQNVTSGLYQLLLEPNTKPGWVEFADSLIIAGACPMQYDGTHFTELGFHYYPEAPTLTDLGAGTGGAGTYSVVATYVYFDAAGRMHESKPSPAASITIAANHNFSITVPTLRLTNHVNVQVRVYCTEANGSVYHLMAPVPPVGLTETTAGLYNTATATSVGGWTYDGNNQIAAGELLYTTGGVLPNAAYPACRHVAERDGRLFFSGCEDPFLVLYTEQVQQAYFPGHSEVYALEANHSAGRVVSTQGLDDKLVVSQEKQIGYVVGGGPNRLGLQNDFTPVQRVLSGYGATWSLPSVTITDADGVWFYSSERGLRHLGRGLQLTTDPQTGDEVGADVFELSGNLVACSFHPAKNQVRFLDSELGMLVWNREYRQFSLFDCPLGDGDPTVYYDITAQNSKPVFLASLPGLTGVTSVFTFQENGHGRDDVGGGATSAVETRLVTSWLAPAQVQGFARIYNIKVIGKPGDGASETNTLGITMSVNYVDTVVSLGGYSFANVDSAVVQIEHKPAQQKCEAFKIALVLTNNSVSGGALNLSSLLLQVGVKKGMFKQPTTQRV